MSTTKPVPVVSMEEVLAHLSERGRIEWELAATKAQLAKALTVEPVAESGHVPEPAQVPVDNGGTVPL